MANKVGATKGSGSSRRKWNGKRWVSAPVRSSTTPKATRTRQGNRRSSSSSSSRTIPPSKRPADMRRGVTYGDAGRPYKGPGGNPSGSGQGQAQQAPPAPKLPPRPSASKPTPKSTPRKAVTPKPTPKKPAKATPKAATAANARSLRSGPTPPKTKRKTSTTQGPTKSGSYYKGRIKSDRLRSALSNIKVRDYKKKK